MPIRESTDKGFHDISSASISVRDNKKKVKRVNEKDIFRTIPFVGVVLPNHNLKEAGYFKIVCIIC